LVSRVALRELRANDGSARQEEADSIVGIGQYCQALIVRIARVSALGNTCGQP
jgi:hypothetical protein